MVKTEKPEEGISSITLREICTLKELDHPSIIKLLEILHGEQKLYLVFEFYNQDLKKYLDNRGAALPVDQVKDIMWQIV